MPCRIRGPMIPFINDARRQRKQQNNQQQSKKYAKAQPLPLEIEANCLHIKSKLFHH